MASEDALSEVYGRLTATEIALGNHISSCTERRLREDDRHKNYEEKLSDIIMRLKHTDDKIEAVNVNMTEIKIKFAVIVAVGSGLIGLLGNLAVEWITK